MHGAARKDDPRGRVAAGGDYKADPRTLLAAPVPEPSKEWRAAVGDDAGDDGTFFFAVTGQAFSDNRVTQMACNPE